MSTPTVEQIAPELQLLTSYLLFERENQTELRVAFAGLVQERHHHFHDLTEDRETKFEECGNQICMNALQILQNGRKPKIEVNEFSARMIAPYSLKLERTPKTIIAYLEEKSKIEKPADGITILEA